MNKMYDFLLAKARCWITADGFPLVSQGSYNECSSGQLKRRGVPGEYKLMRTPFATENEDNQIPGHYD